MIPLPRPSKALDDPPIHRRTRPPSHKQHPSNPLVTKPRSSQNRHPDKKILRSEQRHDGVHDVGVARRGWSWKSDRWIRGAGVEGVGEAEAEEDGAEEGGEGFEDGMGAWGHGGGVLRACVLLAFVGRRDGM